MDGRVLKNVVQALTARCGHPTLGTVPDADLLRLFAKGKDEAAFGELHRRHGPLVWAACRSMLNGAADAEDAYQATFLVLVRSAGKVRNGAAVGAWLHGVAVKVALKLRQRTGQRRAREMRAARGEAERPVADGSWDRLLAAIHEEVETFSTGQRNAFVLCDLQGVPQPDAAKRLGCPLGSLSGWLSKARTKLARRLEARGVTPSVAAAALGVAATGSEASVVPLALMGAVREFAAWPGASSALVQALAKEITTMTQLKWAAAAVLTAGMMTAGFGTALMPTAEGQGLPPRGGGTQIPRKKEEEEIFTFVGRVTTYKYVPLTEGQTSEAAAAAIKRLELQAAEGYDFCGSLEMRLTKAELAAMRAGEPIPRAANDPAGEAPGLYRVLVFKQVVGAIGMPPGGPAAGIPGGGVPGGGIPGAEPTGSPPPTGAPGRGPGSRPGTGRGSPKAPEAVPTSPPGSQSPLGATVPSSTAYRARSASVETLEKVANSLAKGLGGTVTAIGDSGTGAVILTGDATVIRTIVERLEVLEATLGEMKPKPTDRLRP